MIFLLTLFKINTQMQPSVRRAKGLTATPLRGPVRPGSGTGQTGSPVNLWMLAREGSRQGMCTYGCSRIDMPLRTPSTNIEMKEEQQMGLEIIEQRKNTKILDWYVLFDWIYLNRSWHIILIGWLGLAPNRLETLANPVSKYNFYMDSTNLNWSNRPTKPIWLICLGT